MTKVTSKVEYGIDINTTYFAPPRRTKQFFEQIDMLDELTDKFSRQELDKYFSLKYYSLLTMVSYAYRTVCKAQYHAAHYGHPLVYIGIPEMIRYILKAYHDTKAHLKEKGTYSSARQRIMSYCTLKAIIQVTSKTIIRSIIEPLGIWKILHYFRNY